MGLRHIGVFFFHMYSYSDSACTQSAYPAILDPCDAWSVDGTFYVACGLNSITVSSSCTNKDLDSCTTTQRVPFGRCALSDGGQISQGSYMKINRLLPPELLAQRFTYTDNTCATELDVAYVRNGGCFTQLDPNDGFARTQRPSHELFD